MVSDSEMDNASDRSGIGDADSLASTAESEAEAEYLVNDIHAERRFYVEPDSEDDEGIFVTQYLVEWAGYSMDRCSWEPKEMFTSEETLDGWEEKKKQIAEGRVTPFNLKSWERHMALLEKKTKKRKEARRRKREQRARQKSLPQAGSSRLANPDITDAREPEAGIASHRAPTRLSVDSTASALFVPAETKPPSENVAPRQSLHQRAPPKSVTSSAQTNRNEPLGSKTLIGQPQTTSNKLPNSRLSQLARKLTTKQKPPARPKSPPQAAKPTLSSFGTGPGVKRAYRDNKWGERAPDLSQMELRKPSEFAPRTNIGITTSIVGQSVTSPKSLEAQNQHVSENSVSLTNPPKSQTGQINLEAAKQLKNPVTLAPSSVVAPPVPRSSNLSPTALVSSSAVFSDPSAPSNPQGPVGPVDSTTSISSPATQSNPLQQAKLTQPSDSVDTIVSTFSPLGQTPLMNPVGRSTSALTASSPAPYPRAPSHANIDRPTSPPASTSLGFPPVSPGARAEAISTKPAGLPASSLITQSLVIPTRPRAMANFERHTEKRDSQDTRETVRGWDSYKPSSTRQALSSVTTLPKVPVPAPPMAIALSSVTALPMVPVPAPPMAIALSSVTALPLVPVPAPPMAIALSSATVTAFSKVVAPRSTVKVFFASSDSIGLNGNPIAKARSFAPTEPRAGASAQPSLSIAAQIARMPVRDSGGPGCIKIGKYFCNKALGEIIVHVFIGPGKRPLGAFRLCGIRSNVRSSLILAKNPSTNQVEVWFKHLCTVREYERLCESSVTNSVLSTGWVEGFSDTNENLFNLAEVLRKDDLIALHYPMGSKRLAWVAWSRGSQEFKFPHPKEKVPPGTPLLVAARTMLAPIEALGSSGPGQPSGQLHNLLPGTSLPLQVEPPSADDVIESSSPLKSSNFHHDIRMGGTLQPREMPAPAQPQVFPPASELKDNSISANAQPQDNITVQAAQFCQAAEQIMRARNIDVDELATIEESGKLSKAGIFYLHFPKGNEEIQQELQFLQLLLKYHEKIIFTSDSPNDWAKFVQNSRQGVAIFHESFAGYDALRPSLNSVLPLHSFNFWIVRIQRPLELVDPRYCSPSDHHLRIFPYGGVILLTEDMLADLKGVAVTLQWIRSVNKHKRKSWTLMFPPGILEWIERRLGDENHSQDYGLLLLIYTLIIKNNVTDPRVDLFDKASLHPNSKSNVIAPSLDEYGTRAEHHALKINDKVERDADHLIEFFAGWSLINMPRFRNFIAVTSLGARTGPRWEEWGHMTVMRNGFGHFFKRFKIDSGSLMTYLSGASKPRPSGTSQVATPMTMTTPQTPNWTSHNPNAAIQSTLTGSPNGNDTNKYPTPYK
ncbi:Chromo domain/shadow [Penicillium italicum]|uniref:Chromo domain/shadow n=1 Tax=Penicillium italicum TaxID=40296 RepID=A0A0A2LN19_PENIT|nr:Chromo domain/shadow [Penicillium italicum]